MPNWCSNSLKIKGKKTAIQYFAKKADKKAIFQSFIPRPKEFDEGEKWYDWNMQNWGIKWDIEPYNFEVTDDYIEIDFDSAWGPPTTAWETISKLYPTLTFNLQYKEEGMRFKGYAHFKNGITTSENCVNY